MAVGAASRSFWFVVPRVLRHRTGRVRRTRDESENPMPYQVKTAAAVLGGSALLAFAVGCGGGDSGSPSSSTSPTTSTSSSVAPTTTAPTTTPGETVPGGPTG